MREKELEKLKDYKYGFTTDIENIRAPKSKYKDSQEQMEGFPRENIRVPKSKYKDSQVEYQGSQGQI